MRTAAAGANSSGHKCAAARRSCCQAARRAAVLAARPERLRRGSSRELNTTRVGAAAEAFAACWLEAQGARILLRNFRRRRGELDLIAEHRGVLLVVEIRLRVSNSHGGAAASVGPAKQRRIIHTAAQLLQLRPDLARMPVRFDVLAMQPRGVDPLREGYSIEWIRHAFNAAG